MISEPVCVAPTGDVCEEGVVWHAAYGAAYWTDVNRFLVYRFTPADQCVRSRFFDEPVTALTLTDRDNTLAGILGLRSLWGSPNRTNEASQFIVSASGPKFVSMMRSDRRGSLWMGSMRNNVNADGRPAPQAAGMVSSVVLTLTDR